MAQYSDWYVPTWDDHKRLQFDEFLRKYEIQDLYARNMRNILCGLKKVFVIDNSGSMNHVLKHTPLNSSEFGGVVKRKNELQEFVKLTIPFLALDAEDGIDFWFLNDRYGQPGPEVLPNVHVWNTVKDYLDIANGRTPLIGTLEKIFKHYSNTIEEEGILLIVSTDGDPTDGSPKDLYALLKNRKHPEKCIVNFLVCTDNDQDVDYLNKIDAECPYVDVTDDYFSERNEVLKARKVKMFTYNDYIAKACIGAASKEIDEADEKKVNKCCVII